MSDPTPAILDYFEQINAIPRCSHNEARVCQWLQKWAAQRKLASTSDKDGNLVVMVPASAGYENAPTVILQGHMDMVCEKTPDSDHDFDRDPIVSHRAGDWLKATDTTLGADNGIAIAYMLALVDDKSLSHPPLELLFTVDEETGLNGAKRLKPGFITGSHLINLDSEDEGVFTIGCAGGVDTTMTMNMETRSLPVDGRSYRLTVGGLKGGHSGIDIHKQRGNANKILARALARIDTQTAVRIISVNGGSRKNAIPRDAQALIWIDPSDEQQAKDAVKKIVATMREEYRHSETALVVGLTADPEVETPGQVLSRQATQKLVSLLLGLPDGVFHMSGELEGMVETSSNLATVSLADGKLTVLSSQRSAAVSRLDEITATVHAVATLAGASVKDHDIYPPWQPRMDSMLLSLSKQTYQRLYDREAVIQVIHAGLECAVIGDLYPGMDLISFGPTIRDPHSPDESILIPSIAKVWDFLTALLAQMKE